MDGFAEPSVSFAARKDKASSLPQRTQKKSRSHGTYDKFRDAPQTETRRTQMRTPEFRIVSSKEALRATVNSQPIIRDSRFILLILSLGKYRKASIWQKNSKI